MTVPKRKPKNTELYNEHRLWLCHLFAKFLRNIISLIIFSFGQFLLPDGRRRNRIVFFLHDQLDRALRRFLLERKLPAHTPTNLGNPAFYLPLRAESLELLRMMQFPLWQVCIIFQQLGQLMNRFPDNLWSETLGNVDTIRVVGIPVEVRYPIKSNHSMELMGREIS